MAIGEVWENPISLHELLVHLEKSAGYGCFMNHMNFQYKIMYGLMNFQYKIVYGLLPLQSRVTLKWLPWVPVNPWIFLKYAKGPLKFEIKIWFLKSSEPVGQNF